MSCYLWCSRQALTARHADTLLCRAALHCIWLLPEGAHAALKGHIKPLGRQAGVTCGIYGRTCTASVLKPSPQSGTTMMHPTRQPADLRLARPAGKHTSAAAKRAPLPKMNAPRRAPLCACRGSTSWLCSCGAWPQTAQPGSQHGGHLPAAMHSPHPLHKWVDACVYLGESSAGRVSSSSTVT